jgi:hypothetical protein
VGCEWDALLGGVEETVSPSQPASMPANSVGSASQTDLKFHARTLSIISCTSPPYSLLLPPKPLNIALVLDMSTISTQSVSREPASTYHATIARPNWSHSFLRYGRLFLLDGWKIDWELERAEFTNDLDAVLAFEDYSSVVERTGYGGRAGRAWEGLP